jgi:catalase
MARGGDYLREELASRLAAGPAAFTLSVVLAGPGDPLDDPTAAWPLERDVVEMGRLVLSSIVDDPESSGQIVVFDPTHVTDGIELSDDPILHLRGAAYSVSASRRMP